MSNINKDCKIGDSIVNEIDYQYLLTKNKKYIVTEILDGQCYSFIGDNNERCSFIKKYFYTIQEFRDIQMKKILE